MLEDGQAGRLRNDVNLLATVIGPRNIYHYESLERAATYIETSLRDAGYNPLLHRYQTHGKSFANISAEVTGDKHKDEIVVIGAHYDTHKNSPGANDNGSAVAALLELARCFARRQTARTLRFVTFTNEESPFNPSQSYGQPYLRRRMQPLAR